jgi:hypothetical protein
MFQRRDQIFSHQWSLSGVCLRRMLTVELSVASSTTRAVKPGEASSATALAIGISSAGLGEHPPARPATPRGTAIAGDRVEPFMDGGAGWVCRSRDELIFHLLAGHPAKA